MAGVRAPDFNGVGPWLNSTPLTMAGLRGRTVLIDFWTYSCVNCLRTLPHLKRWHERYAGKGLVIIGVHTPEFAFEKDVQNVAGFVREHGIKYAVALDNDYVIWNAYANRYWPHKFLIDAGGYIVYDHAGEGAYAETERKIQNLIRGADPGVELPAVAGGKEQAGAGAVCYPTTPETYCGYFRGSLGNLEGYARNATFAYRDPGNYHDGRVYLQGEWKAGAEYIAHARQSAAPQDYLALPFHALEVNAVMSPDGDEAEIEVTLDDRPVEAGAAGRDIEFADGMSIVSVDGPRMYELVKGEEVGAKVLRLRTGARGLRVYSFTFGGCRE